MDKLKLLLVACVLVLGCTENENLNTSKEIGYTDENGNIEFNRTFEESMTSFKAKLMEHYQKQGFKPVEDLRKRDSVNVNDNVIIYHIDTVMDSTLIISINYQFNPPIATSSDTLYNGNVGIEFSYNTNGTGPVFVVAAHTCVVLDPCRSCKMIKGKCDCYQTYGHAFCCCELEGLSIQDPIVWSFL